MYDFVTIGGTTRDISFFTEQGLIIKNKKDILRQEVLAFELGAKIKVENFYYSYGGGAANTAVCLANFGFRTACLAPVGDDQNGKFIIHNLLARHVSTRLIEKVKGYESSASFILIHPSGERIIFAQRGANSQLSITQEKLRVLKKAKNIYIASLAGNWLLNLRKIFLGVTAGQKVFWNPGMTQLIGGLDGLGPFLKKVTVLAMNKDEATEFVMRTPGFNKKKRAYLDKTENLLTAIHGFGPKIALITLGPDGVMAYDGQKFYRRAVFKEKKRVDSTGVGDIFNSTFAAGLNLFEGDIDKALHLALQNAAAKVAHLGAQNGLIKI